MMKYWPAIDSDKILAESEKVEGRWKIKWHEMAKNYRFNTNDRSNQAYIIQTSIRVKKNQENTTNHMHLMIIEIITEWSYKKVMHITTDCVQLIIIL